MSDLVTAMPRGARLVLPGSLSLRAQAPGDQEPPPPRTSPEDLPEAAAELPTGTPRILISDEHGVYRLGLSLTLKNAFKDWEIVDTGSLEEAEPLIRSGPQTDLALLDADTLGPAGPGQIRDVLRATPGTRFMLLMPSYSRELVLEAIAAGMHGAVSKAQPDDEIIFAVSDVLSGRIYVPPWMAELSEDTSPEVLTTESRDRARAQGQLSLLTPRQKEVFLLVSDGLSNREIAQALNISEATAKIHVAAVFRAVRVRNRTEAALLARRWLEA